MELSTVVPMWETKVQEEPAQQPLVGLSVPAAPSHSTGGQGQGPLAYLAAHLLTCAK